MNFLLRGARVVDPAAGTDERCDLGIVGGQIVRPAELPSGAETVDLSGLIVAPAFTDLHVHLRQPGMEEAETIASGCAAALAGGFRTVVAMPNTRPPVDDISGVRFQIEEARRSGHVEVLPSACITRLRQGLELTDLEALASAGAVAFTDDGSTVSNDTLMRLAMQRIAALGSVLFDHAQDRAAEQRGVMHDGAAARRFGLPGIPADAEVRIVRRDLRLAAATGCRLHLQHLSAAGSVEALRQAQEEGLPVTAEATPHHLALCDDDIPGPDPNYKMNPPLRSAADREAIVQAVADGVISCLATDHAPHPAAKKSFGFQWAPFGVVGLETAVAVTWEVLVAAGRMSPLEWVRRWTTGPAAVLRRSPPSLAPGEPADLVAIAPDRPRVVDPSVFRSLSRNTPFAGRVYRAWPVMAWIRGRRFDL